MKNPVDTEFSHSLSRGEVLGLSLSMDFQAPEMRSYCSPGFIKTVSQPKPPQILRVAARVVRRPNQSADSPTLPIAISPWRDSSERGASELTFQPKKERRGRGHIGVPGFNPVFLI